jgi:hypothetical protein
VPFPQRSRPWLLATAAWGGLKPAPACRLRRTCLHLSCSYARVRARGAKVPTFRTRAWFRFTPPLCRMPPSQAAGSRWTCPGLMMHPGFDIVCVRFRHVYGGSSLRLPEPHLTRSRRAFSTTLTTPALYRSSSWWFGARPYRPTPRGLPSSLMQHGCLQLVYSTSFQRLRGTPSSAYSASRAWKRDWSSG